MLKNLCLRRSWLRASTSTPRPIDTGSNAATSTDSMLYTYENVSELMIRMSQHPDPGILLNQDPTDPQAHGHRIECEDWRHAIHLMMQVQHENISEFRIRIHCIRVTKKSTALKREHPALQNMKFLNFLLDLWLIFALLNPDLDSEYGSGSTDLIESGSNLDPGPKPCRHPSPRWILQVA